MQSPKRTLQILIPHTSTSQVKSRSNENDIIDHKIKLVLLGLEIERLHKVAILITDKYEDKIQQLETTQQLLKDKIENLELKIATLNQQLFIKDDFINEIFDEKCPDEVNKKLNNQLKQVTQQLNRAKKQIETLNEINIIFKKNPPDNPELIDMIKELENNYEDMLQKKDQEITNLKIRNSSYDQSHSQEMSDQKSELLRIQLQNQFLNEKIETILEENEKLKQQLKSSHSVQSNINDQSQYRLVTKIIQQEPFNAYSDFQFLGKQDILNPQQQQSNSPQRTSYQNSQEFIQTLKKIEKIQLDAQFNPQNILSQIRLSATLLHLKRMELPNDLNDTYVKYLNQIEQSDVKSEDQSNLTSTVKPKKLFFKIEEDDTQQKQLRTPSSQFINQKPLSNHQHQCVQVDFLDKQQLDQTQNDLEKLKNEYQLLQKKLNTKIINDTKPISQSNVKNSVQPDEFQKLFEKDNIINRQSDYNSDKQILQQLKRQLEYQEEQLQYLRIQNQRQSYLIKQLQDKNHKDSEKSDDYQIALKNENNNLNEIINTLKLELTNLKKKQHKTCLNQFIQTDSKFIVKNKETQTDEVIMEEQLNQLESQLQFQQENQENNNLRSQHEEQKNNQQNQNNSQDQQFQEFDQVIQTLKQEYIQQQEQLQLEIIQLKLQNTELFKQQESFKELQQENEKLMEDLDYYKSILLNQTEIREEGKLHINNNKVDQEVQMSQEEIVIKYQLENQELQELKEKENLLQQLLEQQQLELQSKQIHLNQLQSYAENLLNQINNLQQNNVDLQQIIKDQETEYQTQLSQIKLRLSALEEQQVKEHSRSISISENNDLTKEINKSQDLIQQENKNNDLEIQIRRLIDEKAILYDQMYKQQQDFKQQIKTLSDDFEFQKLQLDEKIKELENKIVLYVDGDQNLMKENQNLASQVQNLSNQLILARQQNKINSQKKLQSTSSSPRGLIETQKQIIIIKEQENEIIQLRNSQEQLQFDLNKMNELFTQQSNENSELKYEVLALKTENTFEKQENQRLKQQIVTTKEQIQMLNKQLDLNKKNNKKEIDYLNSQLEQYKVQLFSTQSKISTSIITKDQFTQLDTQVYVVVDQDLLDQKDNIIYNLKKSLQSKDNDLDQTLQNLLITRQELFQANNQLLKLRSILQNQQAAQSQVNQYRTYKDSTLYPPKQNMIIFNQRTSRSEERHKNCSQDKQERVSFWKKKYEEVLQQNYIKSSVNSQDSQYKIKFEESQKTCQNHLKDLENYQEQNRQLLQMIDNNQINSNQLIKYEDETKILKSQLYNLKQELHEQKMLSNKYQSELQELQLINSQNKVTQIIEANNKDIENYVNQIFNAKQQNLELLEKNQDFEKQIKLLNTKLKEEDDKMILLKQQQQQSMQELDELKFLNSQLNKEKLILLQSKSEQDQQNQLNFNYSNNQYFKRSTELNCNRSEIMHNLDIIRQELKVYQSKCQIQEFEINQLRQQLQQPIPQQKLISSNKFKEQYEYLNEILKELEITKLQNENLRKQNSELFDYQSKLIDENDNLKRLNINSPLNSPRIQQQINDSQQQEQRKSNNGNFNLQIEKFSQRLTTAKISEIEVLKQELEIMKSQVLNSSTHVKEAESLSLQARVLSLEKQLQSAQNQIQNLKQIIQENIELKQQIKQLKESNSKIQHFFNNNQKTSEQDLSQTEKLNRELTEKISELTQLKIKYKQALTIMHKMENRQQFQ
ncbi:unnamed protein product [Paramecium sonneborni]|uniref:Uncharacterized protein n=1 Tax=Paramecium sonneborni TaxID=65129 RepID=A0A8S1QI51_9CILI|nr:unnamed protein product [Paramecium sonneborni]